MARQRILGGRPEQPESPPASSPTADADVRLACVPALPPPRADALDHVVADTDAEMACSTASVAQTFDAAARRHGDVKVETVVRFGSPAREAAVEAEVYAPS